MDKTAYLDGYLIDPEPTAGTVADFLQENFRHTLERTAGCTFPAPANLIPTTFATPPTIELDCSDITAVYGDNATLSADTTYWLTTASASGANPNGCKITPSNNTSQYPGVRWTFSPVKDLTNYGVIVWFYAHEGSGTTAWNYNNALYMHIRDDEAVKHTASSVIWYSQGAVDDAVIGAGNSVLIHSGWNVAYGLIGNKTVTDFNQANVGRFTLTMDRGATDGPGSTYLGSPSVTIARVLLVPPPSVPYWTLEMNPVLVSGDGLGPLNSFKRLAYLAQQGINVAVALSPWRIGDANQWTLDMAKRAKRMGHTIIAYPDGPSELGWYQHTEAECVQYARYCQAWMRDNGLADGFGEYCMETPGNGGDNYDENTFTGRHMAIMHNGCTTQFQGRPLYGCNGIGMQNCLTHLYSTDGFANWTGPSGYNGIKAAKGMLFFFAHCLTTELTTFDANLATLLAERAAGTNKYISLADAYHGRNL